MLVGGYNPQSWSSSGGFSGYNITPLDADRTAFIFNLKQGLKFDQRKTDGAGNAGQYQTFNVYDYGPSFGGGSDLNAGVAGNLNVGYSFLNSYGSLDDVGRDIARYPRPSRNRLQVGQIEVFTISIVPEPETWALMLAGLGLLGFAARRRA